MQPDRLRRIRFWLLVFMAGLMLSGVTAFPLRSEVSWLDWVLPEGWLRPAAEHTGLFAWIDQVNQAISLTDARFPFLAYGTDWLAFAHLVIAVAFIGPLVDPLRNKWVILFGLIACAGVVPLALIAGQVRDIPLPWRLIDCSFGLLGSIPLAICLRQIGLMERSLSPISSRPR